MQLHAQRFVKAQDENRFAPRATRTGQVLGAVAQNHGLARARHAVDHAVAVTQTARQLLLLQVHHTHDAGQLGICIVVVK